MAEHMPEEIRQWRGQAVGEELWSVHHVREDGNVTAGESGGPGIEIKWQDGPIVDGVPNGATVEGVLELALDRLERLGKAPLRSRYTSLSATDVESALNWQAKRARTRRDRGVDNTYQA